MRVGFVGVGALGGHLARSLLRAEFDLTVHDRDPAAQQRIVDLGATAAASPAHAAADADVVITCLPSPAVAAEVVAGDEGLLTPYEKARPGSR